MLFERKIIKVGGSNGFILPQDLAKFLNVEDGTDIYIKAEEGKYGRYISLWRKDQQKCSEKTTQN